MSAYKRNVSYLDYLENGMKIKNAGFVKTEENNGRARMEIRVRDLPEAFNGQYELYADTGGVIGRISLSNGKGSCCIVWQPDKKQDRILQEAGGFYLRLPDRKLVQTVWPMPLRVPVELEEDRAQEIYTEPGLTDDRQPVKEPEPPQPAASPEPLQSVAPPELPQLAALPELPQNVSQELWPASPPQSAAPPAEPAPELPEPPVMLLEQAQNDADSPQPQKTALFSDKWEQLTHLFPRLHPFGDEREYLSIEPKDFVVLCSTYQKMVHNSFLLHGYYNYHHLLLGRMGQKDQWQYYLGVPGNFYTREKMVAEMFGFEAFEGEKDTAKTGDFGYYMKRVEI